ncbi:MAG: patatin-like phospholipase family protein [Chlamydiota bacterium]
MPCGKSHAKEADKIFEPYSILEKFDLFRLNPKYKNINLEKALSTYIPHELKIEDLQRKALSVSFQLFNPEEGNWGPEILDNLEPGCPDGKTTAIDAILRSSAAPTFFPSYQGYVDGGVVANNPSMVALSRAIDQKKGKKKIGKTFLLSIGTGLSHNAILKDIAWGATPWVLNPFAKAPTPANPLLSVFMEGAADISHYQCTQILGEKYFRFDPFLDKGIELDDWKNVTYLIEEAKALPYKDPEGWKDLVKWVRKNFKKEKIQ